MPIAEGHEIKLEYRVKSSVAQKDLAAGVQEVWEETLQANKVARDWLGLGPGVGIPENLRTAPYGLKRRAGALGTAAILSVAVGFAGVSVGKRVALDIWSKFLLPRFIRCFGLVPKARPPRRRVVAVRKAVVAKRPVRKKSKRQSDRT